MIATVLKQHIWEEAKNNQLLANRSCADIDCHLKAMVRNG